MTDAPSVTVLMPAYNAERYVAEAARSILEQTWRDFELLVIDDGSTDGTLKALQALDDRRLRIERNPGNLGLIATLNRGLELARGRYVARMDADDVAQPRRLEMQLTYLEAHPDIAVLGTAVDLIDNVGRRFSGLRYPTDPTAIRALLIEECCLVHPTVVFRRDVVRAVGGYDPQARHAEDYDLWLRLADRHRLANLDEPLLSYRIHPAQVSVTNLRTQFQTVQQLRERALERRQALGEDASEMAKSIRPTFWRRWRGAPCTLGRDYLDWYYHYRAMRKPRRALAFALRGLRHSPLSGEAWGGVAVTTFEATMPWPARRAAAWYLKRLGDLLGVGHRAS
ncbi:glycosyltransferase family 2 protein [Azohydromonas sediminis]|uniref:glycosyltransferase family 2 protein n=1 Tax=Azohydromonas sediminis TaxID=2259674 RepID=UPI000E646657|nr:glycosyltransferase [Azohydromonas sediminis]